MSSDIEDIKVCLHDEPLTNTLHPNSLMETLEQHEDGMNYHVQTEDGMSYDVIQVESKEDSSGQDDCLSPILHSPSEYIDSQKPSLMNDSLDGEFYVINPGAQLFSTVSCIPVAHSTKQKHANAMRLRDEKKKENHKEVERRRRDKINTWILKLGELIPPDEDIQEKSSDSSGSRSKSLILAKACNYIGELRSKNENLSRHMKANEQFVSKLKKLKEQNAELQYENNILKNMLVENGLLMDPSNIKTDDSNPS